MENAMYNNMIHTPEGVRDIYGDELKRKLEIKNKIHKKIGSYGFKDIETPTFEYFDIYNDVGTTPSKELYKFFDKDGNILALRSDFTPSIARCCSKYFLEDKVPVRLCYEGNSFTNFNDLQGKLKEYTEIGAELIDNDGLADADAEMICLSIEVLKAAGLKDFMISVGQIDYFKSICDEINLSEDDFEKLRSYIALKNYFGAREFLESLSVAPEKISNLLDVTTYTSVEELTKFKTKLTNEGAIKAIDRLVEIYEIIKLYGLEKYVSFDLLLINKFHYYTGVIFRAYTYGTGDAVIKGGRYDKLLSKFGKDSKAIGFSVLIDDLLTAMKAQDITNVINEDHANVIYDEKSRDKAFARIKELRERGTTVSAYCVTDKASLELYKERSDSACIRFETFLHGGK